MQNDFTGFWEKNSRDNSIQGLGSLLPTGTVIQVSKEVRKSYLANQITWESIKALWNKIEFMASFDAGQISMPLADGGFSITGPVNLVFLKSQFGKRLPEQGDTIKLWVDSKWKNFIIQSLNGSYDPNDDSLSVVCEPEDADNT